MPLENTKKVCNFLLYWMLKNNIKDILSNRTLPPGIQRYRESSSFRWVQTLALLLLVVNAYYLFFLKMGFRYLPFYHITLTGLYALSSLPLPIFLVYIIHKNRFFKNISYAECKRLAHVYRSLDIRHADIERGWESRLIATLNHTEQEILFRLGAEIDDLRLIDKNSLYKCLQKDTLQWLAMQAFVKTEKPLPFESLSPLNMAYELAKQKMALEKMTANEEPESIDFSRLRL